MVKKDGSDAPEKSIHFKINSQDDLVVFNGIVMDVGSVVREERKKRPDAQICYHSIKVDEADPQKFCIDLTHNVVFIPKAEGLADKGIYCHNLVVREELSVWNTDVLNTLRAVRWAAKGRMLAMPSARVNVALASLPGRSWRCSV